MTQPEADLLAADRPDGTMPLPHSLKQKLKDGLVALSIANLFFIRAWFAALYHADFGYFNKLPVTKTTLLALAANFTWLTALAWLLIRVLRRWQNRWFHLAVHVLFFAFLLLPVDFCRALWNYHFGRIISFLERPVITLATALALALILWQHRKVARVAATVVGLLSPLALYIMARTVLLLLGVEPLPQYDADTRPPPLNPARTNQARVLWMIFDEMDERLVFEQRPADVKLPEFDRLRAESLAATNAFPPGDRTLFSMPALISGQHIAAVELKNASDLAITLADNPTPTTWSQLPSVFGSARELGVNTALVGWYNPYGRVLGKELNYCAWYPFPGTEPTRGPTFGGTFVRQILCPGGPVYWRHIAIDLYRTVLAQSLMLSTNDTYGLTLLHLPLPHKPGIYNPKTGRFTLAVFPEPTEYFNSLVLADRFLGAMRRAMESSGDWGKTWVIVSTDHSWRFSEVYDGRRDLRVPFLVKAPGLVSPVTYSPRMNTLLTHDLILAILRGELHDQAGLVSWLDTHRSEQAPIKDY